MKKLILILITIFTLSFVSCSNEDEIITPDIEQVEQKIDSTQYYILPDTTQEVLLVYETTYQVYRKDGYLPSGEPNPGEGVGEINITRVTYIPDCLYRHNYPIIFKVDTSDPRNIKPYEFISYPGDTLNWSYYSGKKLPEKYMFNQYSFTAYSNGADILSRNDVSTIYNQTKFLTSYYNPNMIYDYTCNFCIYTSNLHSDYIDNIQLTMKPARNINIESEPIFKYVNWFDYSSLDDPKYFNDFEDLQQYVIGDRRAQLRILDNTKLQYNNLSEADKHKYNIIEKYKESGYSINRLYQQDTLWDRPRTDQIIGKQYSL